MTVKSIFAKSPSSSVEIAVFPSTSTAACPSLFPCVVCRQCTFRMRTGALAVPAWQVTVYEKPSGASAFHGCLGPIGCQEESRKNVGNKCLFIPSLYRQKTACYSLKNRVCFSNKKNYWTLMHLLSASVNLTGSKQGHHGHP